MSGYTCECGWEGQYGDLQRQPGDGEAVAVAKGVSTAAAMKGAAAVGLATSKGKAAVALGAALGGPIGGTLAGLAMAGMAGKKVYDRARSDKRSCPACGAAL